MDDGCDASVTIPIQGRFGTTRFFLRSPTTGAARISLSFHRSQGGGNHMPRGAKAKAPWPFSTGSESEGQGLQNLITQFTQTSRSLPAKLVQGIRSFDLIPRSSSSSSFLRLVLCRAGSLCRAAAMCTFSIAFRFASTTTTGACRGAVCLYCQYRSRVHVPLSGNPSSVCVCVFLPVARVQRKCAFTKNHQLAKLRYF